VKGIDDGIDGLNDAAFERALGAVPKLLRARRRRSARRWVSIRVATYDRLVAYCEAHQVAIHELIDTLTSDLAPPTKDPTP